MSTAATYIKFFALALRGSGVCGSAAAGSVTLLDVRGTQGMYLVLLVLNDGAERCDRLAELLHLDGQEPCLARRQCSPMP